MGERLICIQEVIGSNPIFSTIKESDNIMLNEKIKDRLAEFGITKDFTFSNDTLAEQFWSAISKTIVRNISINEGKVVIDYVYDFCITDAGGEDSNPLGS